MRAAYAIWLSIPIALWLLVFAVFDAKAGELWLGVNYHHLSQLDAGPPFNEEDEDSLDHVGFDLMVRDEFALDWAYYFGVGVGRNFNITDSESRWNDGGAEADTMLFIGVQKRLYSW